VQSQQSERAVAEVGPLWWVFLGSGILWFAISLVVLRFNDKSITTVGVIMGVVLLVGGLTEIVVVAVAEGTGWKIFHAVVALLFVLAAIWAFTEPKQAFWALASVLGFVLLIVGVSEIVQAVVAKQVNPLWWLGLLVGVLFIVLAFWTSQQLVTVQGQLLLFYVGLFALFRGVSQIVLAFGLRSAAHQLDAT
jgi:uncharacterized membrane protein HdeD (DUF308 family)